MIRATLWAVTLVRVALLPVFLHLGLEAQELGRARADAGPYRLGAIATLLVMGASDLLDGWIARRFDLATRAGAIVDAVADKTVQVALVAFFALSLGPVFTPLPLWFLVVVLSVESLLLVGYVILRARYGAIDVVHHQHGRLSTLGISLALFWSALGLPAAGLAPLVVFVAAVSVGSATIYALQGHAWARSRARG
jgi:cardiolipin synthase (CMP-forming)